MGFLVLAAALIGRFVMHADQVGGFNIHLASDIVLLLIALPLVIFTVVAGTVLRLS